MSAAEWWDGGGGGGVRAHTGSGGGGGTLPVYDAPSGRPDSYGYAPASANRRGTAPDTACPGYSAPPNMNYPQHHHQHQQHQHQHYAQQHHTAHYGYNQPSGNEGHQTHSGYSHQEYYGGQYDQHQHGDPSEQQGGYAQGGGYGHHGHQQQQQQQQGGATAGYEEGPCVTRQVSGSLASGHGVQHDTSAGAEQQQAHASGNAEQGAGGSGSSTSGIDAGFIRGVVDVLNCFLDYSDTVSGHGTAAATPFDGFRAPPISVERYCARVSKYIARQKEDIVVTLILLDRILSMNSDVRLTMLNFHRLFLVAMVVSVKSRQDLFYTNAYYAQVGGVQLAELNELERHFLCAIDFETFVLEEKFHEFMGQLQDRFGYSFQ